MRSRGALSRLSPTAEEIRATAIPDVSWLDPLRRRMPAEDLRERLARENKLREVMEPVFRRPQGGWADERTAVRILDRLVGAAGLRRRARRNFERIEVQRREWRLPGLGAGFDGFRILHVSDFHLDFDPALTERLRTVLDGLDYDLACLTGDFFDLVFDPETIDRGGLRDLLALFRAPVRAVLGNHDILAVGAAVESFGARVFLNEHEILERGGDRLVLAGVDDPRLYRAARFDRALAGAPGGLPILLLAHSPQVYREAAAAGASLVLCGHTHGGQVSLPFGIPVSSRFHCPLRFVSRDWKFGGTLGYTSHGCGGCKLPYRLNAPAEVAVHTLRA